MTSKQTTLERIEAFVKLWPGSEFGPARMLLGDYNVSNVHILSCMRYIITEISERPNDKELKATFVFLLSLSEIDEYTRWNECWPDEEHVTAELSRSPLFK